MGSPPVYPQGQAHHRDRCQRGKTYLEHTSGIQATQQLWDAGLPQSIFADKEINPGKEIKRLFKACIAILVAETWGWLKSALLF